MFWWHLLWDFQSSTWHDHSWLGLSFYAKKQLMKARRKGKLTRGQSLPSRHFLQGFGPFRLVHVPQVRKRHPGRSGSVRVVLLLLQRLEAVPLRFLLLGLLFAGSSWEGSIHSKAFQFKNMRNSSSEVIGQSQKMRFATSHGRILEGRPNSQILDSMQKSLFIGVK